MMHLDRLGWIRQSGYVSTVVVSTSARVTTKLENAENGLKTWRFRGLPAN